MIRLIKPDRLALLACMAGLAGCSSDFLSVEDPNQPTQASTAQLFVGHQAAEFAVQEGSLAMAACMFTQQCEGIGGRFVQEMGEYNFTSGTFSGDWSQTYAFGGLVDLREVERRTEEAGDRTWLGIARVWEAFSVGTAASIWGDIPYTEIGQAQPHLDPQLQVYDQIQALLTTAIGDLNSGTGSGPGALDLVYGGDRQKWIRAANTLKARFYMHTAEVRGAAAYNSAITAALAGIQSPAGDFTAAHTTSTSERNIWFQFQETSFGNDLVAGSLLVNLLKARNDPRLPQYFGVDDGGHYTGGVSPLRGTRIAPDFRQPLVTYIENELILAEAYQKTGNDPLALQHLNLARASVGLPALAGLTGTALFQAIVAEKYIAMFQNIEAWNDYKRTCFAGLNLVPLSESGSVTPGQVPGRVFYGQTEENANPNIPSTSSQLSNGGVADGQPSLHGFRNANDPTPCTAPS
ncbi:MAG TPA: SusD/RagB family nutrient-binding outer membrane lipoprotein [Longimicrobium sp.]|nr:SusD/RagB family nutrient-binding outer membrane lipoprotein [Longimicrobium sp.]